MWEITYVMLIWDSGNDTLSKIKNSVIKSALKNYDKNIEKSSSECKVQGSVYDTVNNWLGLATALWPPATGEPCPGRALWRAAIHYSSGYSVFPSFKLCIQILSRNKFSIVPYETFWFSFKHFLKSNINTCFCDAYTKIKQNLIYGHIVN